MDSTDTLAKEGCVKFVERFSGIKFTGDINNSEAVSEYLDNNNREDAHLAYLCGEEALARKRMIEAGRRKQQEEK